MRKSRTRHLIRSIRTTIGIMFGLTVVLVVGF
jgi:hypothetical protein